MEFLEKWKDVDLSKLDKSERDKYNKTFARIQKTIDERLEIFYKLADEYPEIYLDEARELEDETLLPHRRIMKLVKILYKFNPRFEVELHLKTKEIKI